MLAIDIHFEFSLSSIQELILIIFSISFLLLILGLSKGRYLTFRSERFSWFFKRDKGNKNDS